MKTPAAPVTPPKPSPLKVVALGGGHGLAASLSALRHITTDITAVVTVADDGGSSGRLRQELDVLPPGDLRMALAALCAQSSWGVTWRDVLQHRFQSEGPLNGHSVGNLLIVTLWELLGDPVTGLELIGELLGAEGRVLPMAAVPLEIEADVTYPEWAESQTLRGQSRVAVTSGYVHELRLVPEDPPVSEEAIEAINGADWVIFGPGSWYTSVITHLLVPELAKALKTTQAKVGLTLNLASQPGETGGFSAADHLRVFQQYAPEQRIDTVIADPSAVEDIDELNDTAKGVGARVLYRQVSAGDGSARHDSLRLAAAYRDVFEGTLGDVGANQ
ncbi:MAG TPA: uridine diphosphate-N-acetylglucosamine-binding protein YvcK [Beutenbergiaceae bacterium]|nr:uridine diphosphate-N-acetylglucosamine-binding protein YvcK [Beutenbergiaceae bacterium]